MSIFSNNRLKEILVCRECGFTINENISECRNCSPYSEMGNALVSGHKIFMHGLVFLIISAFIFIGTVLFNYSGSLVDVFKSVGVYIPLFVFWVFFVKGTMSVILGLRIQKTNNFSKRESQFFVIAEVVGYFLPVLMYLAIFGIEDLKNLS